MKLSIAATIVSAVAVNVNVVPCNGVLRRVKPPPFKDVETVGNAARDNKAQAPGAIPVHFGLCDPSDPVEALARIGLNKGMVGWVYDAAPESATKEDGKLDLDKIVDWLTVVAAGLCEPFVHGDANNDGILDDMELTAIVAEFLRDKCASDVIDKYGNIWLGLVPRGV